MARSAWLVVASALALACSLRRPPPVRQASVTPTATAASPAPAPTPESDPVADARHLLNRLSFGPRPGEVERVSKLGAARWLEAQLAGPEQSPLLDVMLVPHRDVLAPPAEIVASWLGEDWENQALTRKDLRREARPYFREHDARLALAELTRHVVSERQVEEVMVDFWSNHFNIYVKKGFVRLFAGDYVERAIRPHALGRFSELVLATARHPAMLIYLDNVQSSAPGAAGARRGLNENYARELLELHTLGVDGGYTQADVTEVARLLTGWSVTGMASGVFDYVYRDDRHDKGAKVVLGRTFPAGHGEDEGVALIELVSRHPATARHLAHKLCTRFVADAPPAACVDEAARAFLDSGGDIKSVLRAIVSHESFWRREYRGAKLKTPVELVASASRALGALPDDTLALAGTLAKLGEPLLEERVPTGYPDSEAEWATAGGMLARMNFASDLGSGKLAGLRVDLDALLPVSLPPEELLTRANELLFAGRASRPTLDVVREELSKLAEPRSRRSVCLALLLGSPEFQRQ